MVSNVARNYCEDTVLMDLIVP